MKKILVLFLLTLAFISCSTDDSCSVEGYKLTTYTSSSSRVMDDISINGNVSLTGDNQYSNGYLDPNITYNISGGLNLNGHTLTTNEDLFISGGLNGPGTVLGNCGKTLTIDGNIQNNPTIGFNNVSVSSNNPSYTLTNCSDNTLSNNNVNGTSRSDYRTYNCDDIGTVGYDELGNRWEIKEQ